MANAYHVYNDKGEAVNEWHSMGGYQAVYSKKKEGQVLGALLSHLKLRPIVVRFIDDAGKTAERIEFEAIDG